MKIKPVKKAKDPNYPIIDYYIKNPGLLSKNIPESWIRNKYVATSLATFILIGSPKTRIIANQNTCEILEKHSSDTNYLVQDEISDPVKIAPVFAHGDGSGATGCVVMSPPVFISEDEARKIIFDKLNEEGFVIDTIKTDNVKFKSRQIAISCIGDDELKEYPEVEVEIKMDGYDPTLNLAIEFVSVDDYFKFAEKDNLWGCSVIEFGTKKAAEIIREELVKNGKSNTVVFYDPITSIDFDKHDDWRKSELEAKEEATKLLLAQVEDFIKWIKKEKILRK